MPLHIVRNDITKMEVDAIVNTANPHAIIGDGVDTAINWAAGPELILEREKTGDIPRGEAILCRAYRLKAKYVIQTVGPWWDGGESGERETLANCYWNSLKLAEENRCETIAFPLIASGSYRFPKEEALSIAVNTITKFLMDSDMTVYLVVYDKRAFALSKKLLDDVQEFIDNNYTGEHGYHADKCLEFDESMREYSRDTRRRRMEEAQSGYAEAPKTPPMSDACDASMPVQEMRSLDDLESQLGETFQQMLLRLISDSGQKNSEVYHKANIEKSVFSRIKLNVNYQPSKVTAVAFAIALKLNYDQTVDLLSRAGFALSPANKFDVIIKYFVVNGRYNIFDINELLFDYDQPTLGC